MLTRAATLLAISQVRRFRCIVKRRLLLWDARASRQPDPVAGHDVALAALGAGSFGDRDAHLSEVPAHLPKILVKIFAAEYFDDEATTGAKRAERCLES